MALPIFLLLGVVGLLGAVGCLTAILFLVFRLGGRSEGRGSAGGCLLGAIATVVFVTLGGLGLLVVGGLVLAGTAVEAGVDRIEEVEVQWLPDPDSPEAWTSEDWTSLLEVADPDEGPVPAATSEGEVVLRVTVRGTLPPGLQQDLRERIATAVGRGELPPLTIESPPGLDRTLVEVLLPITREEAEELRAKLEHALDDLRALQLELESF